MKLRRLKIAATMVTDLPLTANDIREALEKMVYAHEDYDREETVAALPFVGFSVEETQ